MPTVLESLTKKLEVLGEGKIYEEDLFGPESLIAVWEFEDPRVYKQIFNLDNKGGLGIEKSLKSFLIEVKDSLCTFYYITGESCLSIDFSCKYQMKETIREVPLSLTTYLRVLCGKKAPIEISIDESFIYIVFEDSLPKTKSLKTLLDIEPNTTSDELIDTAQKKRKKKEKPVAKKYVLELPLHNTDSLDLAVIELFKEVLYADKEWDNRNLSLPIDLSNISYEKEPLNLFKYEVKTNRGNLRLINNNELSLSIVVCPMEIAKSYEKDRVEANEYVISEDADVDYTEDYQELNDIADAFMIGEEDDTN